MKHPNILPVLLLGLCMFLSSMYYLQRKECKAVEHLRLSDQYKQLVFANNTSNTSVSPVPELAFQLDTQEVWEQRWINRNFQRAKTNAPSIPEILSLGLKDLFQIYWEPTFSCAFPIRIGTRGDGGKWVCNPQNIRKALKAKNEKVIVYSLGSHNEYSFELGIHEAFGADAEIHTFDMDAYQIPPPDYVNFHHMRLVGEDRDGTFDSSQYGQSINAIRKALNHVGKSINIFKIDIEGSEYEVLKSYVSPESGCTLNANMILMETHWDSAAHYTELFTNIQNVCGMEIYMKEPNIQYSNGDVIEWCFVKIDWNKRPMLLNQPIASLGYQIDSPKIWYDRYRARNIQKNISNAPSIQKISTLGLKELFQVYWEPTFSCSFPTRIGKWVCNAQNLLRSAQSLGKNVIIYSLGSRNEYSFEREIKNTFGSSAEIHTFDMFPFTIVPPSYVNFHHMKLVSEQLDGSFNTSEHGQSITAIRNLLNHVNKPIDIFKIDIEGSEYEVLKSYVSPEGGCTLNANMILMETHWDSAAHYTELFTNIQSVCGMEIYMKEPNIQYSNGDVIEWYDDQFLNN